MSASRSTGWLAMIPLACSIVGSLVGGYGARTGWRIPAWGWSPAARCPPQRAAISPRPTFCGIAASVGRNSAIALTCISASMFFLSFAQSGKWTLVTAVAPQSYSASVASIQNFGSYIGGAVSPLATGMVVDATGVVRNWRYGWAPG